MVGPKTGPLVGRPYSAFGGWGPPGAPARTTSPRPHLPEGAGALRGTTAGPDTTLPFFCRSHTGATQGAMGMNRTFKAAVAALILADLGMEALVCVARSD